MSKNTRFLDRELYQEDDSFTQEVNEVNDYSFSAECMQQDEEHRHIQIDEEVSFHSQDDEETSEPSAVITANITEEIIRQELYKEEEVPNSWDEDDELAMQVVTAKVEEVKVVETRESEDEKLNRKLEEVSAWATSLGMTCQEVIKECGGTLTLAYEEMTQQCQLIALRHQADAMESLRAEAKVRAEQGIKAVVASKGGYHPQAQFVLNGRRMAGKPSVNSIQNQLKKGAENKNKVVAPQQSRRERKLARIAKETQGRQLPQEAPKARVVEQIKLDDEEEEESETEEVSPMPIGTTELVEVKSEVKSAEPEEEEWAQVKLTKKGERTRAKVVTKKQEEEKAVKMAIMGIAQPPQSGANKPQPKTLPQTQPISQTNTRMCSSVVSGKQCPHGSKCRFAHKTSDLQQKPCKYGSECRFVHVKQGKVLNKENSQGRVCQYWHNETVEMYLARMGIKMKVEKVEVKPQTQAPVPVQIKLAPQAPPAPVKLAPWAIKPKPVPKVVAPTLPVATQPRKTRWDTDASKPQPFAQVAQSKPRASRWGAPVQQPLLQLPTIQVPRGLYEKTVAMCKAQGMQVLVVAV